MKKIILIMLLFSNLVILNSLHLDKFYNKNYNFVDRTVFVFNDYPGYIIEKDTDSIIITINRSSFSQDIKDLPMDNNPVLKFYQFFNVNDDLKIIIQLNRDSAEKRKFRFEDFVLKGDVYKLVLDVFKYETPMKINEFNDIIYFYEFVGMQQKVSYYKKMLEDFKLREPGPQAEEEELLDSTAEDDKTLEEKTSSIPEKQSGQDVLSGFKNIYNSFLAKINISYLLILALFIVAIILVIILISFKKQTKKRDIFHAEEKLGSNNFRMKVIDILREAGWEDQVIADELGITTDEVKKTLKK